MKLILFAGFKGGGKTTTLTKVAKELSSLGFRVASIKNVRKGDVKLIDKDSWQHFISGANPAVLVSNKVIMIHERPADDSLEQVISYFRSKRIQYVLVEGMYKEMRAKRGVFTIVCARNETQLKTLLRAHKNADIITGLYASSGAKKFNGIKVIDKVDDIIKAILKKAF